MNVDGITFLIDVGTEVGSVDGSLDYSNGGKLEGLFLGDSLVYTDGKVISSDKGKKLGSYGSKVLGNILGKLNGIIFWIDVGTETGSLYGSFDVSNDGSLEG